MKRVSRDRGLTLIELVVAMAVFALVAVMGLQSLSGSLRMRDGLTARAEDSAALAQAIAVLRRRGLLVARKGVGTRVAAIEDDWRSRFTANTRGDLFDFAHATELRIEYRDMVEARGKLATEMGVRPGRKFYYMAGPRFMTGDPAPFCFNEVYLDPRMKPVMEEIDTLRVALFTLVENHTGDRVEEIQQEVRALHMPDLPARHLARDPGALCVRMTRRFNRSGSRLLEYAIQYHPGDRFSYQTTLSST